MLPVVATEDFDRDRLNKRLGCFGCPLHDCCRCWCWCRVSAKSIENEPIRIDPEANLCALGPHRPDGKVAGLVGDIASGLNGDISLFLPWSCSAYVWCFYEFAAFLPRCGVVFASHFGGRKHFFEVAKNDVFCQLNAIDISTTMVN